MLYAAQDEELRVKGITNHWQFIKKTNSFINHHRVIMHVSAALEPFLHLGYQEMHKEVCFVRLAFSIPRRWFYARSWADFRSGRASPEPPHLTLHALETGPWWTNRLDVWWDNLSGLALPESWSTNISLRGRMDSIVVGLQSALTYFDMKSGLQTNIFRF